MVGTVQIDSRNKISVLLQDFDEQIAIRKENSLHALNGDLVKVYLLPRRISRTRSGQIVEIVRRSKELFVGTLFKSKHFVSFVPDSNNLGIEFFKVDKTKKSFADKDKAIVKIVRWEKGQNEPLCEIVKVLGPAGNNNVEMESILTNNDFSADFDPKVLKEAEKIDFDIEHELTLREDFRKTLTFTIDPEDAKDFDDALSFKALPNGNCEVGVHIADVTNFVKPGSAIDKEAYKRATSVYLVDRTIPMLPERLCNELCSLRQGEDSLTFSVVFEIGPDKEIVKHRIGRTVIHSDKRFCYDEVQKIIETKQGEFSEQILRLWDIANNFRTQRLQKGAIDFNSPEYKFDLDENSKPIGMHIKISKQANWLVEEWMLMANRTVAEEIGKVKNRKDAKTFVYRVHDEPNPEKVETFKKFASKLGYLIDDHSHGSLLRSYNNILTQTKGKTIETMISSIALRTMSKAFYTCDNIGHYGLSYRYYTHFTSPIRRYPDMMVHRLLALYFNKGTSADKQEYEEYCKHCSEMERKAADAERESVKYKQAEFLSDKIGQEYDAEVSGVSKWGIFALTEQDKCEGLIRISTLKDDFYMLDEENYRIVGRDSGKTFSLGQKIRVKLVNVDLEKRQIDFLLSESEQPEIDLPEIEQQTQTEEKDKRK